MTLVDRDLIERVCNLCSGRILRCTVGSIELVNSSLKVALLIGVPILICVFDSVPI